MCVVEIHDRELAAPASLVQERFEVLSGDRHQNAVLSSLDEIDVGEDLEILFVPERHLVGLLVERWTPPLLGRVEHEIGAKGVGAGVDHFEVAVKLQGNPIEFLARILLHERHDHGLRLAIAFLEQSVDDGSAALGQKLDGNAEIIPGKNHLC